IPSLIVHAVVKANQNIRPAEIAFGRFNAPEFVVCRRYFMQEDYVPMNPVTRKPDKVKTNPAGLEDKIFKRAAVPDAEVCFVGVKDLEGNWISVLANYGLHYAADWPDDTITADYFGSFSKHIKEKLQANDNFVPMMSNGTSGDVNIWDFLDQDRLPKGHFEKTELIGKTLANRLFDQVNDLKWDGNPQLAVAIETLTIKRRKPSADEYQIAAEEFKNRDFDNLSTKPDFIQRIYDREQVLLSEYPDTEELDVQVLKLGSIFIGALPGEFFAETGLKLKQKHSNIDYFSINLSNSYGGYIPPKHEFENGGYETWRARSSSMHEDTEEQIRLKVSELIQRIQ
ncbi:MAG: hypothetical protein ACRCVT_03220, partial [Leadbetterella sp.]